MNRVLSSEIRLTTEAPEDTRPYSETVHPWFKNVSIQEKATLFVCLMYKSWDTRSSLIMNGCHCLHWKLSPFWRLFLLTQWHLNELKEWKNNIWFSWQLECLRDLKYCTWVYIVLLYLNKLGSQAAFLHLKTTVLKRLNFFLPDSTTTKSCLIKWM